MNKEDKKRNEARAKILKALAHPARIFIVDKLNEKPFCVCELTDMLELDTSTVSKHLSVLRNAGVIESDKQGTTVYYSLKFNCIMKFIGCIEEVGRKNSEEDYRMYCGK